jgi:hypothetical protein
VTEAEFTDTVLRWAKVYRWRRFHVRGNTRRLIQGDVGFVDLVLVRKGCLIFAELKVGKNKPAPEQEAWLAALRECKYDPMEDVATPIQVYVWYPQMFPAILEILAEGLQ